MNAPWLKALWAFLGAVVQGTIVYVDDGQITSGEVPLIISVLATLIGVYFIPNVRNGRNVQTLAQYYLRSRYRPDNVEDIPRG